MLKDNKKSLSSAEISKYQNTYAYYKILTMIWENKIIKTKATG